MANHEEFIYIRIEGREEQAPAEEINNKVIGKGKEEFKQFDIIPKADDGNTNSSIDDHHYCASFSPSLDPQTELNNIQTNKRIMKEWKILQESLPDSIYVRAYEERIDLLRAVIVGASGTPYHDGLFFFDIQFPSDYPNHPPKVYYHSFGFRLNPNLYPRRGIVCLSLLNTFVGQKNERWNPSESTILQVLVSIQALVLNAKPYFNNPNLPSSSVSNGEDHSKAYNQEVFVLSCKTMLAVLNKPPRHFEEFVGQHFRDRAETILIACKACWSFSMEIIFSRLLLAFIKNGSSLKDSIDDHWSRNQVEFPAPALAPAPAPDCMSSWLVYLLIFTPGFFVLVFILSVIFVALDPHHP